MPFGAYAASRVDEDTGKTLKICAETMVYHSGRLFFRTLTDKFLRIESSSQSHAAC